MKRRFTTLILGGFLLLLSIGCGTGRGAYIPPVGSDLEPNYLRDIGFYGFWHQTVIPYKISGGLSVQRRLAKDGTDLVNGPLRGYREVWDVDEKGPPPEGSAPLVTVQLVSKDLVALKGFDLGYSEVELDSDGSIKSAKSFEVDTLLIPTQRQALGSHEALHWLGWFKHVKGGIMREDVPLLDIIDKKTSNTIVAMYKLADAVKTKLVGKARKFRIGDKLDGAGERHCVIIDVTEEQTQ